MGKLSPDDPRVLVALETARIMRLAHAWGIPIEWEEHVEPEEVVAQLQSGTLDELAEPDGDVP